jgi:Rad3-related DNA helicase
MNYASVTMASAFPPASRPIYVHSVAEMTRKNKSIAYPLVAEALAKVLDRHRGDRCLVHTVSYDLNRYLMANLPTEVSRLVSYDSSSGKQRAIDRYLYREGSILLAPSLDRGIDLPGNDCRVIIVCKVPFPSLGDKQVSAKLHSPGGQLWYSVKTVRSLVQMTGRGMRSEDDYCESYILDASFMNQIWKRHKNLLPEWWKAAVDLRRPPL